MSNGYGLEQVRYLENGEPALIACSGDHRRSRCRKLTTSGAWSERDKRHAGWWVRSVEGGEVECHGALESSGG